MAKRDGKNDHDGRDDRRTDDALVIERLRRHLEFLGLTLTLAELDERLAWATRERPGATALLEHVLGAEAAHKLEQRIARRIAVSGLVERKALEAFDWLFQPKLDKALVLELARLDFVRRREDLVIMARAAPARATCSRRSAFARASRASACATPDASTSSTTYTPASPTAPTPAVSRAGHGPRSSSSTTSGSDR
jgi:hypothetical protein